MTLPEEIAETLAGALRISELVEMRVDQLDEVALFAAKASGMELSDGPDRIPDHGEA